MSHPRILTSAALSVALCMTAAPAAQAAPWNSPLSVNSSAPGAETPGENPGEDPAGDLSERDKTLLRLIEEEKVAYDLYTAFKEKYGTRPFHNISNSESKHQNQVLVLITAAGLEDPRLEGPGTYNDPDLQEMYDSMLERGMVSLPNAYQVGHDFEAWDIAGLEEQIAATPAEDTELLALLNYLLQGSRNHLDAFSRQLARG